MDTKYNEFNTLKPGSHIPGYQGYCPQEKFHFGHTFSTETHLLSKHSPHFKAVDFKKPIIGKTLREMLPDISGTKKYVSGIIPGYTGYVPFMPFLFGKRYRMLCQDGIHNFLKNQEKTDEIRQEIDLAQQEAYKKSMTRKMSDYQLKNELDYYQSCNIKSQQIKNLMEPPIPGYKGYVPRMNNTETGLGARYHEASKKSLQSFGSDQNKNKPNKYEINSGIKKQISNRIYKHDGMIPLYTGHCPQHRNQVGGTFSDLTRKLPICKHNCKSYGEYIKNIKR
ncbi:hypothetical protein A3Q56_04651 [Intoshia linei]|uniref:Protein FAM166B n=1 Tax=Intoshia linei TaxID=1819745 RepID=A0A177B0G0_9BILA|nr:hypothetical protein A3Q56_04651 [Intoshia linei]